MSPCNYWLVPEQQGTNQVSIQEYSRGILFAHTLCVGRFCSVKFRGIAACVSIQRALIEGVYNRPAYCDCSSCVCTSCAAGVMLVANEMALGTTVKLLKLSTLR